jgi:hypothetical protein
MQINSPTAVTWWVTVVAAVIGLVIEFTKIVAFPFLGIGLGFWILFLAFVLLAVACLVKGL